MVVLPSARMRSRVAVFVFECVCLWQTLSSTSFVSTCQVRYVGRSFRLSCRFYTRGFSIKPSLQKLWHEKSNLQ